MNQDTREVQKMSITVHSEAGTAVTEALREAGIESIRFMPGNPVQGEHACIELCLTALQAAKVIDTVLPAVTLQTRGYSGEVVVASLGPHTGPQSGCGQETVASGKGETPYATE